MTPDERAQLINAYILYYQTKDVREQDALFWSWERVNELRSKQPFLALEILHQLVHATRDSDVLSMVASGPVIDLMREHGELILEELVRLVRNGSNLRHSIYGSWHYMRSESVKLRMQEMDQWEFEEDEAE